MGCPAKQSIAWPWKIASLVMHHTTPTQAKAPHHVLSISLLRG